MRRDTTSLNLWTYPIVTELAAQHVRPVILSRRALRLRSRPPPSVPRSLIDQPTAGYARRVFARLALPCHRLFLPSFASFSSSVFSLSHSSRLLREYTTDALASPASWLVFRDFSRSQPMPLTFPQTPREECA